jgi:hypothetical protein
MVLKARELEIKTILAEKGARNTEKRRENCHTNI